MSYLLTWCRRGSSCLRTNLLWPLTLLSQYLLCLSYQKTLSLKYCVLRGICNSSGRSVSFYFFSFFYCFFICKIWSPRKTLLRTFSLPVCPSKVVASEGILPTHEYPQNTTNDKSTTDISCVLEFVFLPYSEEGEVTFSTPDHSVLIKTSWDTQTVLQEPGTSQRWLCIIVTPSETVRGLWVWIDPWP